MDKKVTKLWTGAEIELIKKMAAEGLSASEIAQRVGRTRNSVIGAVHRNRVRLLFSKPEVDKTNVKRQRRGDHLRSLFISTSKPRNKKYAVAKIPPHRENYVPFLERKYDQCKYIVEKREDNYYCCGNPVDRKGWCAFHAAIVYRPFDPKPTKPGGNRNNSEIRSPSK